MDAAAACRRDGVEYPIHQGLGKRSTKPALSTIIKLCSLLDVSSDYLLGIDNRDPLYLDDFSENDQILIRAVLQTMKNVRNSSI